MSRPTRTGLRITTILVSMVVGVVAVILVVCIALFLDRYRSAIVQNARTSSAQAVSQVSNTVSNYLQDMSQAMQLVIGSLGESPDSRDELLDAFLNFRPDVVAVTSYDESGALLDSWALDRQPRRISSRTCPLTPKRPKAASAFLSAPPMWRPSLRATTPGW